MEKTNLNALINLLDDPDEEVFFNVKENLLSLGTHIIPDLEKAWEQSLDENYQERIENIIQKIQYRSTKNELENWNHNFKNDLLKGAYLLAKYQYPDLDFQVLDEQITQIKKDVWLEINDNLTALEKVKILNHILFEVHGFLQNKTNFYSPQNSYINYVLESKKGNPISLAIIYLVVARRLRLPIFGVNLPKNFILAYVDEHGYFNPFTDSNENVLFYINPYNKGAVFGKKDIEHFIKIQKLKPQKSYFAPCSNSVIIFRLIEHLILSYKKLGYPDKIEDLNNLLELLDHGINSGDFSNG